MRSEGQPLVLTVVTRLNIGGPAILTVMLTREMRRFGFRTALVSGTCEPDEGDMSFLLEPEDGVFWIPRCRARYGQCGILWRSANLASAAPRAADDRPHAYGDGRVPGPRCGTVSQGAGCRSHVPR